MASNQPQPGDIWEHKSGERRMVQSVHYGAESRMVCFTDSQGMWAECFTDWNRWQSGATLIERKEPTQ